MIRFVIGVGLGAALMYWYLTGEIPFRDEVERFFTATASSYSGSEHVAEAEHLRSGG
jgi:hypothetical protein